jgi:hypothetical protein
MDGRTLSPYQSCVLYIEWSAYLTGGPVIDDRPVTVPAGMHNHTCWRVQRPLISDLTDVIWHSHKVSYELWCRNHSNKFEKLSKAPVVPGRRKKTTNCISIVKLWKETTSQDEVCEKWTTLCFERTIRASKVPDAQGVKQFCPFEGWNNWNLHKAVIKFDHSTLAFVLAVNSLEPLLARTPMIYTVLTAHTSRFRFEFRGPDNDQEESGFGGMSAYW